ncbi:MAG: hypothetical protein JSV03_08830 [Planctomycetota bacterium]|nr:MAG: hypothetical protein JSV03_08830 [Planctomycetota bacterium]
MSENGPTKQPIFGSPYRRGRENPDYQADRMAQLCDFNARIIDAYSRQIREQHRRGRKMWDGSRWQEQHVKQLEQALQEADNVADERGRWIEQLEEAKEYLSKQLENEKQTCRELQRDLDKIHNSWWWRLGRRLRICR